MYSDRGSYVKESTPVAVKAANTLPEPKPGSDGSVTLLTLLVLPMVKCVIGYIKSGTLALSRMELVRLHLKMKVAVQLFELLQQLLSISIDKAIRCN